MTCMRKTKRGRPGRHIISGDPEVDKLLRAARKATTHREVHEATGLTTTTLTNWAGGKGCVADIRNLDKLARFIGYELRLQKSERWRKYFVPENSRGYTDRARVRVTLAPVREMFIIGLASLPAIAWAHRAGFGAYDVFRLSHSGSRARLLFAEVQALANAIGHEFIFVPADTQVADAPEV